MVGIDNLKWRDAVAAAFRYFTREQASAGWPEDMTPTQIAGLQRPHLGPDAPESLRRCQSLASKIVTDCQSGELLSTATTRTPEPAKQPAPLRSPFASAEWQNRDGFSFGGMPARIGYRESGTPPKPVTTYHVTAADFAAWLAAQGEKPSEHIAAWFDAVGVSADAGAATPQPAEPVASESKEDRQDRRLQLCLDAGLEMPNSAVGRMPYGIGKVAEQEGVTRQTFTDDVKAALARKIERERPKPMLVPKRR